MASTSEAMLDASDSFYQCIIALERSDEKFSQQIAVAFNVLEIEASEISILHDLNDAVNQVCSGSGPREEWFMRWLLKRLDVEEIQSDSPCLESRAWLLLRHLVARLPTTVSARALSTHKFTTILEKVLHWTQENFQVRSFFNGPPSLESQTSNASSSSATVQVSTTLGEKSKKRKRDYVKAETLNAVEPIPVDFEKLYLCICCACQQIQSRTADLSEGVEGFAAEHMKAAIKCSPDRAAKILGSSILTVRHMLEHLEPNHRNRETDVRVSTILPMIAFWDSISATNKDSAGGSTYRAFLVECLVPALQLILSYSASPHVENGNVVRELEKMVAIHFILPARNALLRESRTKERNPDQAGTVLKEMLKPLAHAVSGDFKNFFQNQNSSALLSIPLLYEIALKCFPLKTHKQRLVEAPWLQTLLFELTQCATPFPSTATSSGSKHATRDVLKSMLRLAIISKIRVDVSMLERFLFEISGLTDETPEAFVDWSLVSLCLQVDESLVLPRRVEARPSKRCSLQQSKDIVAQLLARITTQGKRETFKNDESLVSSLGPDNYDLILDQIVLPILAAFVHVRDLNSFIEIWQHQLYTWRNSRSLLVTTESMSNFAESVWESDKLLESVSAKLEASLTLGQISKVVGGFFDAMQLPTSSLTEDEARYYANATIMDSLLDGLRSEAAILELAETASIICRHISAVLCSVDKKPQNGTGRLWRILISIVARWQDLSQTFETAGFQHDTVVRAQQLVEQALLSESPPHDDLYNYGQALYAFQFILALIPVQGEVDACNIRAKVVPAIIGIVVKSMKNIVTIDNKHIQKEDHDVWLNLEGNEWTGSLNTHHGLLLGCAAQIVLASKCLSCLDEALVNQFFTQLYWCTCLQTSTRQSKEQSSASLCFLWLWQELLERSMIHSEGSLFRCLCRVQVTNLNGADIQCLPLNINHHHIFSVDNLLRIPVDGFDRQERAKIANVILSRVLGSGESMEVTTIRSHVSLLIKCMELPNKNMNLVSAPRCLWGLAKVLDNVPDEEEDIGMVSLLRAFNRLARVTLGHIITESIKSNNLQVSTEIYQSISDNIQPSSSADSGLATSIVLSTSIESLWAHREPLKDMMLQCTPSLADLRQKDFQRLLDSSIVFKATRPAVWRVGILFKMLMSYSDLFHSSSTGAEDRSNLQSCMDEFIADFESQRRSAMSSDSQKLHSIEELLVQAKSITSLLKVSQPNAKTTLMIDGVMNLRSKRAKRDLLRNFENSFLDLDIAAQADLMSRLVQRESEGISEEDDLIQMQRTLLCQTEPTGKSDSVNALLVRYFSALCDQLGESTTLRSCILRMHCMDIMLRKKAWAILQWHVDNLLSAITVMTSSTGPKKATELTSNIFTGLCRLFASLLAVHRSKLGGRYHLIVLGLQGLLHCLFQPYVETMGKSTVLVKPPWLDSQAVKLDETHVAMYTRLLTAICDPTVSAVTRSKNRARQELNDETKKARSIAGQHLQYLIMEFCQCQLQGRLSAEMRTALNPGLYAIFDAMSQDTMRTINSALDSSARSIFKVIYEDYRRSGRWHGG